MPITTSGYVGFSFPLTQGSMSSFFNPDAWKNEPCLHSPLIQGSMSS